MSKMYESRTIKACKAWLGLCSSGVSLKDSTVEDAVTSFKKLVEVAEGYENLCNTNEDFIKSLLKTIADQGVMIDNLRKDLDGMGREVERLRELNKNQAKIIANNRTKRSDFNV
jgi:lipid II:glycine glycyltransferase (peptidoglycan interpeptide bridge formation enzyme)